ncbi:MAG: TerB family tellurite resistance protein [Muribaculaceae bacterium]|nr:TerB family tellurite resistance protein [Muribaculaceae bacterium]
MNDNINNPQEQQRLGQLKNLVMLASADEKITDSEMAVLLAVASRENITPEEFNQVLDDPDSVDITLPEDEETKLAYLRDMVAMMMIDGDLDEQELAICKLYAMALGYRGSIVDGMIAGVIDSLDAGDAGCNED